MYELSCSTTEKNDYCM